MPPSYLFPSSSVDPTLTDPPRKRETPASGQTFILPTLPQLASSTTKPDRERAKSGRRPPHRPQPSTCRIVANVSQLAFATPRPRKHGFPWSDWHEPVAIVPISPRETFRVHGCTRNFPIPKITQRFAPTLTVAPSTMSASAIRVRSFAGLPRSSSE